VSSSSPFVSIISLFSSLGKIPCSVPKASLMHTSISLPFLTVILLRDKIVFFTIQAFNLILNFFFLVSQAISYHSLAIENPSQAFTYPSQAISDLSLAIHHL